MTITILRRRPGQSIPRPMNRACSLAELNDLLVGWDARSVRHAPCPNGVVITANVDTEEPVCRAADGTEFFAFTEE